ncbi:hypothetical protein GCM10009634_06360 [Saccharothrix xinjiangensis]
MISQEVPPDLRHPLAPVVAHRGRRTRRRTTVPVEPKPYTVRLRAETFAKAAQLAGFSSDYRLPGAMGLNRSTVTRVRSGALQPGPAFIGGALTALAPMRFEDLFEVAPEFRRTGLDIPQQEERTDRAESHPGDHRPDDGRTGVRRDGLAGNTRSGVAERQVRRPGVG